MKTDPVKEEKTEEKTCADELKRKTKNVRKGREFYVTEIRADRSTSK